MSSLYLLLAVIGVASCLPVESPVSLEDAVVERHSVRRRFVSPEFDLGASGSNNLDRIRTKRRKSGRVVVPTNTSFLEEERQPPLNKVYFVVSSDGECERLALCKLHARSQHSFFSTFQLYFVNKENAKQWDHRARSMAECEQRFGDCYRK